MAILGFPLLIIPIAIYNIFAFLIQADPSDWLKPLFTIHMMSGADWTVSAGELLIALALVLLFFEIVKATRHTQRSIIDHMLSTLVFIGALVEFLLVRQAGTSIFALLIVICLVDVVGGYSVSIRSATRDYTVERADTP
ncbi:MAG TPA: hypothetical protein VGD36_00550 [Xanthobacteraceae bacterium]